MREGECARPARPPAPRSSLLTPLLQEKLIVSCEQEILRVSLPGSEDHREPGGVSFSALHHAAGLRGVQHAAGEPGGRGLGVC